MAAEAFSGFQKLMSISNGLLNCKRAIDEEFREAAENGHLDAEPWSKVKPIIGAEADYERLQPQEVVFLVQEKKSELLNDIALIYRRAVNNEAVISQYNELRLEFSRFLADNSQETLQFDQTHASVELEGADIQKARAQEIMLNGLIGNLLDALEKDCLEIKRIVAEYHSAAVDHYGDLFPEFRLEWHD